MIGVGNVDLRMDGTGSGLKVSQRTIVEPAARGAVGSAGNASKRRFAKRAVLLTSRGSYELGDKPAMAWVRNLAAISATSALALRIATVASVTLVGLARRDSVIAFCGGERLGGRQK